MVFIHASKKNAGDYLKDIIGLPCHAQNGVFQVLPSETYVIEVGARNEEQLEKICRRLNAAFEREATSAEREFFFYAEPVAVPGKLPPDNLGIEFRKVDENDLTQIRQNGLRRERNLSDLLSPGNPDAKIKEHEAPLHTRTFRPGTLEAALCSVQPHLDGVFFKDSLNGAAADITSWRKETNKENANLLAAGAKQIVAVHLKMPSEYISYQNGFIIFDRPADVSRQKICYDLEMLEDQVKESNGRIYIRAADLLKPKDIEVFFRDCPYIC